MKQEIRLTQEMSNETKIKLTYLNLSKNRMKTFYSFKHDDILTAKKDK